MGLKLAMFEESDDADMVVEDLFERILDNYEALYDRSEVCHVAAFAGGTIIASVGVVLTSEIPFRYLKLDDPRQLKPMTAPWALARSTPLAMPNSPLGRGPWTKREQIRTLAPSSEG